MDRTPFRVSLVALALLNACTYRDATDADASTDATADTAIVTDTPAPPTDAPVDSAPDVANDVVNTDASDDATDATDAATSDTADAADASDSSPADVPLDVSSDVREAGADAADVATTVDVPDAREAGIDVVAPVDAQPEASLEAGPDAPAYDLGVPYDAGGCMANFTAYTPVPGLHVELDAGLLDANPPHSGDHFGAWARWGVHAVVIPRHYWVHNLEHGGVVIGYRCDGDCSSLRAQLRAFVLGLPEEPTCSSSGVARRVILTEDPSLVGPPISAVSWGFVYRANCLDATSLTAFVADHIGRAPEDICFDGSYPP